MKKIYTIDKENPIVEFIRQQIEDKCKHKIGICDIRIDNRALCNTDLYGQPFNVYTMLTPTINVGYFGKPKVENPPKIVSYKNDNNYGHQYYEYSCNTSIKLKRFIEKFPQYKNITDWATPVPKTEKCKYSNNSSGKAWVKRPDEKYYVFNIPKEKNSDKLLCNGSTEWRIWMESVEEKLTIKYHRDASLDEVFNIKRDMTVFVDGVWYFYDYMDGVVEIFAVSNYNNEITKTIKKWFDFKPETLKAITKEVESCDLEVKEIKWSSDFSSRKEFNIEV